MWKPYTSNLAMMRSCGIQSKALDRSVNSAPKTPPLSTVFFHFSINHSIFHYNTCSEYIQRRTRITRKTSKGKLRRIITNAYKIICFTHTKISTPAIFFIFDKILWIHVPTGPMSKYDSHHPQTPAPTLLTPPTVFSRLVKLK